MNPKRKLTVSEAAAYLHVSTSTLKRWRRAGHGPAWMKPTDSLNAPVLYELGDLDMWAARRKA